MRINFTISMNVAGFMEYRFRPMQGRARMWLNVLNVEPRGVRITRVALVCSGLHWFVVDGMGGATSNTAKCVRVGKLGILAMRSTARVHGEMGGNPMVLRASNIPDSRTPRVSGAAMILRECTLAMVLRVPPCAC